LSLIRNDSKNFSEATFLKILKHQSNVNRFRIVSESKSVFDAEAVEWRRLLSERETTARELASTLRQVEAASKSRDSINMT
jgi:hypothetical protein